MVTPQDIALRVQTHGLPEEKDALYSAVAGLDKFPETVSFLKTHPVQRLIGSFDKRGWPPSVSDDTSYGGSAGAYGADFEDGKLLKEVILIDFKNKNAIVEGWRPGWTGIAPNAVPPFSYYTAVLVHELGHHFHTTQIMKHGPRLNELLNCMFEVSKPITQYGRVDCREWIAESFTAYHYFPKDLEAWDPRMFAFFKTLLERNQV